MVRHSLSVCLSVCVCIVCESLPPSDRQDKTLTELSALYYCFVLFQIMSLAETLTSDSEPEEAFNAKVDELWMREESSPHEDAGDREIELLQSVVDILYAEKDDEDDMIDVDEETSTVDEAEDKTGDIAPISPGVFQFLNAVGEDWRGQGLTPAGAREAGIVLLHQRQLASTTSNNSNNNCLLSWLADDEVNLGKVSTILPPETRLQHHWLPDEILPDQSLQAPYHNLEKLDAEDATPTILKLLGLKWSARATCGGRQSLRNELLARLEVGPILLLLLACE